MSKVVSIVCRPYGIVGRELFYFASHHAAPDHTAEASASGYVACLEMGIENLGYVNNTYRLRFKEKLDNEAQKSERSCSLYFQSQKP